LSRYRDEIRDPTVGATDLRGNFAFILKPRFAS
jgi:hypothetical protein